MRIRNAYKNKIKMEKYTLTKAIEVMTEIASNPSPLTASLFTPQDVIKILQSIEAPEPTMNRAHIPEEWVEHFLDNLVDCIEDNDLIDYDSAEFSIRYNNEIHLENINLDTHNLVRGLRDNIQSAIDEVNNEIKYAEEIERSKAEESQEAISGPQGDVRPDLDGIY
jgi:hypothetical protein